VFLDLYGEESGRRRFRTLLKWAMPFAVVGVFLALIAWNIGSVGTIYSGLHGLFSPASIAQPPSGVVPTPPPGCTITGGTNYGNIEQNCK
jgi:hypothetical protein